MTRRPSRLVPAPILVCWRLHASHVQQLTFLDRTVRVPKTSAELTYDLCCRESCILLYLLPDKDSSQSELWAAVGNARAQGGSISLIAIAVRGISSYASVLDGAREGIASVVEASPHLDLFHLRAGIEDADRSLGAARVWSRFANSLSRPLSDPAVTLLRRIVALAQEPISLQALADTCQLHERSLRKYCAKHHLPEPNRLIAFVRLLRAAHAIDEGMDVDTVCAYLAFPSSEALRKLTSRTLRIPLSHLLYGSAVSLVMAHMEAALFSEDVRPSLALVR